MHFFQARENLWLYLDVLFSMESLNIQVPCDLRREIVLTDHEKLAVLRAISDPEAQTQIFQTSDKAYQAVLIFRSEDLGKLERIFVETPKYLFEFIACRPGVDCIR